MNTIRYLSQKTLFEIILCIFFYCLGNETAMFFTIHLTGQWIQLIGHSPTPESNATGQQWRIWSDTTFQSCLAVICSSSYQRIATVQVHMHPSFVLNQILIGVFSFEISICANLILSFNNHLIKTILSI